MLSRKENRVPRKSEKKILNVCFVCYPTVLSLDYDDSLDWGPPSFDTPSTSNAPLPLDEIDSRFDYHMKQIQAKKGSTYKPRIG